MKSPALAGVSAVALAAVLAAPGIRAQTTAVSEEAVTSSPGDTVLPPVSVTARPDGSLTVPSVEQQRDTLMQTVGSVGFIDSEAYKDRAAFNLRDTLADTPGVYVQNRYGQELRLSIRGSGIARGYHLRGIEVLMDGIPVNMADGSGDFYQIDPLAARAVEIYRGGNGLFYGSSTLGGAVNFVSPTAFTAVTPNSVTALGGSFGTARLNAQLSRVLGGADFMINATGSTSQGYRDHMSGQYGQFNVNLGYRVTPDVETRFYVGSYLVAQKLPGALSLYDALHDPRKANPAALSGNQARDVSVQRLANKTTAKLEVGQVDVSTWIIYKSLFHPIFQVIDQDGFTFGVAPRYTASLDLGGYRNDVLAGARIITGNNRALQFLNIGGSRGAQTLNSRQNAYNYEVFAENRFYFLPQWAFMLGAKGFIDQRDYINEGGYSGGPGFFSDKKTYTGLNPKVGLLWEPAKNIQAFIDFTGSQDVPDFGDLTQTTAATTSFVPLAASRAWTLEIGTRGSHGVFDWDVTAYQSWLNGELLQYTTNASIPASTFNANATIHQGIEFGARVRVLKDVIGRGVGDTLTIAQVWNLSNYHFQNDPQYGNNRIAGTPVNVLRTTVSYNHPSGFYFTPIVDWVPDGAFADYANTLKTPGYVVVSLQTGWEFRNGLAVFVDARNINNARYVSDLSTITDARTVSTAVFYPGDGPGVFAGMRARF
ncbi:TonB-dependent receptor family protein [Rhodopila sp.]|uniref:TonB-dependent receptor family protein n=1 Tax=Rhodopila sp. TaxID=2480087 RepID=UPI002B71B24B|nr:TonB-dependent receptor [Rhodopila sp.]HVZ07222.1 TonB-dependent receptor [Rhodopila sp.]